MNMDSDLESDDEFFENFENIVDKERPSDIRKKVKYYQKSRDEWKERNAEKRVKIQVLMTKSNRLENKVEEQEKALSDLEKKLSATRKQVRSLEEDNNAKDREIESLKKKLKL